MRKSLCSRLCVMVLLTLSFATVSFAQVAISVSFGPPALPVYTQPICPEPGYLWTPGYWAWDPNYGDYYWVPGTWILAPQVGYLWTPPWWGWGGGAYIFHAGYWGPQVGFYGGINYGWGYFGHGYEGGRWNGNQFYYNRTVNNINVTNVRNVYNVTVVNNNVNRVSYNGGPGGIEARPTTSEQAAERERHVAPVAAQEQQVQAASRNQQLRASVNQGRPPIAATPRPGSFNGAGVVQARAAGAPYHPPARNTATEPNGRQPVPQPPNEASRPANEAAAPRPNNEATAPRGNNVPRPPTPIHAQDVAPHSAPAASNPGNSEAERQAQQRQQQINAQQQQEHEKLQQQQEQDHQRMAQQNATNAQMQQMERQHQQQTMQMEQRHAQQEQPVSHQAPPAPHNEAAPHGEPSGKH